MLNCSVYSACSQCVQSVNSSDPLPCGWCYEENKCTAWEECEAGRFSQDSCPPVIESFTPNAGPLQGGTLIHIHGHDFGSADLDGSSSVSIRVEVALEPCVLDSGNMTDIWCFTGAADIEREGRHIELEVIDRSLFSAPYKIDGNAKASTYSYRSVEYSKFEPRQGPSSGGTNITVYGTNLDAGREREVKIGNLTCEVISVTHSALLCETAEYYLKLGEQKDTLGQHPLSLKIDGATFTAGTFSYRPDPQITAVSPLRSFISGGLAIQVTGKNLDVISSPRLHVEVTHRDLETPAIFEESCDVISSQLMTCKSPNITSAQIVTSTDQPFLAKLSFIMDGVESLADLASSNALLARFYYLPDPVIHEFPGQFRILEFFLHEEVLEIKGEDLDLSYSPESIQILVGSDHCNVTKIERSKITCKPKLPSEEQVFNEQPKLIVTVRIGNLEYELGYLEYNVTAVGIIVWPIILCVALLVLVLSVVVLLLIMRRNKMGPWKIKKKVDTSLQYSGVHTQDPSSDPLITIRRRPGSSINDYNNLSLLEASVSGNLPDSNGAASSAGLVAIQRDLEILLSDQKFRVRGEELTLGEALGHGHFGKVYQGVLRLGEGEEMEVAVKTLQGSMVDEESISSFIKEALVMKNFQHENILTLIGVCIDHIQNPMIVLPYMRHGDLLSYLRDEKNSPTVKDLLTFAIQISEGMKYLSNLKFVHRDLAARNCMLDDHMTAKVADFGLSRDIYERDYYSLSDKKAKLPVKWMALECLEKGSYTTKSDVWSYGVVLWELMTRGVVPYPEVDNWDIIKYLHSGRRMARPAYCPIQIYHIMEICWQAEPATRPNFSDLPDLIQEVVREMMHHDSGAEEVPTSDAQYVNLPTADSVV